MSIARVDYRERQRLTAADLIAEQEYRLAIAGRHHLGPHQWGVVRGLHVEAAGPGQFVVWPGVAIDGYGREIVVPESERIQFDRFGRNVKWSLWLYYCDRPEQVPPGRVCEDYPAPRASQRYVLRVEPMEEGSEREPVALADARAAGHQEWRPWPVLLARQGATRSEVDLSAVRYVRHRAAAMRAPSGRATLQLGLRNREDLHRFLLSTRGSGASLEPRLGIDRGGDIHVWRSLVLTGASAGGSVAQGDAVVALQARMVTGIGASLRFEGRFDLEQRKVEGSFVTLGADRPALGDMLAVAKLRSNLQPFIGGPSHAAVSLISPKRRVSRQRRAGLAEARRAAAAALAPPTAEAEISTALAAFGGLLSIKPPIDHEPAASPPRCGDIERVRAQDEAIGPVVQCRPGAAAELEPSHRAIQAVTVSSLEELVPRTELRIVGGGHDESDDSSRVALGRLKGSVWEGVVEVSGAGGVRVLGDQPLNVTGALYLPAIGPSDPLLPDLLALAFTAGLTKVENKSITITIVDPADAKISRGKKFSYAAELTGTATVTIKRTFEVIVGTQGPADLSFRRIPDPAGTGDPIDDAVTRHRAAKVKLFVLCLVEVNQASRIILAQQELTFKTT